MYLGAFALSGCGLCSSCLVWWTFVGLFASWPTVFQKSVRMLHFTKLAKEDGHSTTRRPQRAHGKPYLCNGLRFVSKKIFEPSRQMVHHSLAFGSVASILINKVTSFCVILVDRCFTCCGQNEYVGMHLGLCGSRR